MTDNKITDHLAGMETCERCGNGGFMCEHCVAVHGTSDTFSFPIHHGRSHLQRLPGVSSVASDITDETIEAAARALARPLGGWGGLPPWDQDALRVKARLALEAALAGRMFVELPEPDDEDEYGPSWDSPAGRIRVEDATVWDQDSDMDPADAEAHGLALVAAARLAAGSVGSEAPAGDQR